MEVLAQPAAKRYASAVSMAAAAEARIAELTEALEGSERLRLDAESQLSAITYPADLPRVWDMSTDPPPAEVEALFDITNGIAYVRSRDGWVRTGLGYTSVTIHEWPIEDFGPCIAMADSWGLTTVTKAVDAVSLEFDKIRRQLYDHAGVPKGPNAWYMPGIAEAVIGAITADARTIGKLQCEASNAAHKLRTLERTLVTEEWPDHTCDYEDPEDAEEREIPVDFYDECPGCWDVRIRNAFAMARADA